MDRDDIPCFIIIDNPPKQEIEKIGLKRKTDKERVYKRKGSMTVRESAGWGEK